MVNFSITNMFEKSVGYYEDLLLHKSPLTMDYVYFAKFVESILKEYNKTNDERIDVNIDEASISKYNLPFDNFTVSLYREGYELEDKDYTSNYMYFEHSGLRTLWVDLYYKKDYYDSNKITVDIVKEMNNCFNRDLNKYLTSLKK